MSWVTVIWSVMGAFCLTLAAQHLLIGIRQRARANLLFVVTCLSATAIAGFELALMRSRTPESYGELVQWVHVPVFLAVASLTLFVRTYLDAGRWWLAWATIAVRGLASLVVNFLRSPNLNFTEISGLMHVSFLGEDVSVAQGVVSGWTRLGELSSLLEILFLLDVIVTVLRRGDRRAALVGGSFLLFFLLSSGSTALVHAGVTVLPYMISLSYLAIIATMSYELTSDVVKASDLSRRLDASEASLREKTRQIQMAAAAADLGCWSWDLAQPEIWMDDAARHMRGVAPRERLDFPRLLAAVHPDDRDQVRRFVEEAIEEGSELETEYRILRRGEVRWIVSRGAADRDRTGKVVRLLGVSIDTTRRKAEELETKRRESELAHLSRAMMLGELSGSLAHELNQPLTAILSNAQAAQRLLSKNGGDLEMLQPILDDIIDQGKRSGEVIRRLRQLLRKGEVDFQALYLGEVVEDVLKLMRNDLLNRGVSIWTELSATLPSVRGDRIQVQQVLVNLIANGCDAMSGSGSAERRIVLAAEATGDRVEMSVSDSGPGIPPADIESIFEPFVTTKAQGMGLGLTVCRTILSAHGGRLWASNNAEGGATFHFTLPAAGAEPELARSARNAGHAS